MRLSLLLCLCLSGVAEARHERHLNRALFERNTFMTMVASGHGGFISAMKTFGYVQNMKVTSEPSLWPPVLGLIGLYGKEKPNQLSMQLWAKYFLRGCKPETCGILTEKNETVIR